jgi:cyanophycinase-like exopeptidase
MGRLLVFTARLMADGRTAAPLGVGIDEATALVVDERGVARVLGDGSAYVLAPARPPATCTAGAPLEWDGVPLYELGPGDTFALSERTASVEPRLLSTSGGVLEPIDPY